jgi:hypothetical protein
MTIECVFYSGFLRDFQMVSLPNTSNILPDVGTDVISFTTFTAIRKTTFHDFRIVIEYKKIYMHIIELNVY